MTSEQKPSLPKAILIIALALLFGFGLYSYRPKTYSDTADAAATTPAAPPSSTLSDEDWHDIETRAETRFQKELELYKIEHHRSPSGNDETLLRVYSLAYSVAEWSSEREAPF